MQVKVTRSSASDGGVETLIRTLERGEFFGERALQSCVCIILIQLAFTPDRSLILQHPFHGLFSRTTWVSRYRKGRTALDFNEARDVGMSVASAGLCGNHLHFAPDR